jgi:hypothetical protein
VFVNALSVLPAVTLCANIGLHPPSLHFPFGYLESSFIASIKKTFGQFPREWRSYFTGVIVPLAAYDFLDGRTACLCGKLFFQEDGALLVLERFTRRQDALQTQPGLYSFVASPRVPVNPFLHITPPHPDRPL